MLLLFPPGVHPWIIGAFTGRSSHVPPLERAFETEFLPIGPDPGGLMLSTVGFSCTETDAIICSTAAAAVTVSNPVMEVTESRDNGPESPVICGLA